jgi:hypothetical protein
MGLLKLVAQERFSVFAKIAQYKNKNINHGAWNYAEKYLSAVADT